MVDQDVPSDLVTKFREAVGVACGENRTLKIGCDVMGTLIGESFYDESRAEMRGFNHKLFQFLVHMKIRDHDVTILSSNVKDGSHWLGFYKDEERKIPKLLDDMGLDGPQKDLILNVLLGVKAKAGFSWRKEKLDLMVDDREEKLLLSYDKRWDPADERLEAFLDAFLADPDEMLLPPPAPA